MRRDLDANNLNGLLAITSQTFAVTYDVIMCVSVIASVILCFQNQIKSLRNYPEESMIVITALPFLSVCTWEIWCLFYGHSIKAEFSLGGKQSQDGAIQYKFWTDCLTLVTLFMMIVYNDLLMNTRTLYTIYAHAIVVAVYVFSRALIIFVFKDPTTDAYMPMVVLTQILQIMFYCCLCLMAYFSRVQKEMSERAAYLDVLMDQMRLQELRKSQQKKRSKAQTLQERVIDGLKKAQTALQVAAFERSTQGEIVLIEKDEELRQAVDVALDADDLFAVGVGGGDDDDDVLNIYSKKKKGETSGQKRKTAEDKLSIAFDQQEFFTSDIMPDFSVGGEIERMAGTAPGAGFKLLELSEKEPQLLVKVAMTLIEPVGDDLSINRQCLQKYFYQIQRRYHSNPYHNSVHGAMVGHMSIAILKSLGVYQYFAKQDLMSLVIAAIGHDVGHPGLNNSYLVNSQSLLTRLYNDNAILENYHSFLVFRFAQIAPEVNIFQNLPSDEWREIRQSIIEYILVTDMSQHFTIISKFRVRRTSDKFDLKQNVEDQQFVARLGIKMADLSHSIVDWPQHLEWSFRVTKEFYLQGEIEKANKLPVSPLCDSATHPDFAKSQAGFLQFVVTPLAAELGEVDETGIFNNDLMNKLLFNRHKWELLREKNEDVPLPSSIESMAIAPTQFAEAVLYLTLKAKTVDDLNSNPLVQQEIIDLLSVVQQQAVAAGEEEDEESGSDAEKKSGSGSGSSSSSSGGSSSDDESGSSASSKGSSGSSSSSGGGSGSGSGSGSSGSSSSGSSSD
ncbi:phosphdiesterase [Gregarina niphandrodes]|uniref:Phosphodiesterase n=1 Tax=Gregarina niphandrodes TaxID=110365 RepID=A0A023B5U1_GRENI|nr:phosphdiesterase [Gregarina niphandrodes]EZG62963.1 phosphdiesterase [Gregarina niphandrodes]|eukprot:XP_011130701.1 phosphdiesterase [Gregarina niphandrodes]